MTVVQIVQQNNVVEINNVSEVIDIVSSDNVVEIVTNRGIQGVAGQDGVSSETFERVSKNLKSYPYSLNYMSGQLTSVVYDLGSGQSITKTLNYSGSQLSNITLSGDTPVEIDLIKSLSYTGDNLTGVFYS